MFGFPVKNPMKNLITLGVPNNVVDLGSFSPTKEVSSSWPTQHTLKVGNATKHFPITYLDKDTIEEGQYVDPKTGGVVKASRKDIESWAKKLNEMSAAGVLEPSIPMDHSRKSSDNLGIVKRAKVREVGGKARLVLTHALVGDEAPLIALRNRCSLGIDPNYVDGKGKKWGSVIVHSAITPDPVVAGMGEFTPAQLSRGQAGNTVYLLSRKEPVMAMDPKKKKALCKMLGMDDSTPDETLMSKVPDEDAQDQIAKQDEDMKTLGRAIETLSRDLASVTEERDQAQTAVTTLSRDEPEVDDSTLYMLSRSLQTEREAAIVAGGVDEATAKKIDAILNDGNKPSKIALSRIGDDMEPVAFKIWQSLRNNRPVAHGGRTGIQLARQVPNAPAKDEESAKRVHDRMLAKAGGSKK